MPTGECGMAGCTNEYTYAERDEDSDFVSYSVTPHDVEDVERRAFAVCGDCAREIEAELSGVVA